MKKLFPLAIVAILIGGCAGSIIRPRVEDAIRDSLPEYIGPAKNYSVHTSGSATEMLSGKLDSLKIEGDEVQVDPNLTITKLCVQLNDVRVDTDTRAIKSIGSTAIKASISESSVNRYIKETRGDSNLTVKLEDGKIRVQFAPSVAGVGIPLSVTGKLLIAGEDKINFQADAGAVGRLPIPAAVINKGLERMNPVIDLSTMKFPVSLKEISIRKGAADVTGSAKFMPTK